MFCRPILLIASFSACMSNGRSMCHGPATTSAYLSEKTDTTRYDRLERPGARSGQPDEIQAQFYMTQMNEVDEKLEQVTVGGYLRVYWSDRRLAFNSTADGGCFDKVRLIGESVSKVIWKPDLYIDNLVSKNEDASMCSISPNGSVWYSRQIGVTVKCPFNFGRMPFDTQICNIVMASYGHDTSMLRVTARGGQIGAGTSGIGITGLQATSPVWTIDSDSSNSGRVEVRDFGGSLYWDYLYLRWLIARKPLYFFYQVFIPDTLFLIISYTGFFVDATAVPARATMAIIPVLIMRILSNSVYESLPQISDPMWVSDYLLASMLLSCFAAVEFSFVQFLLLLEKRRNQKLQNLFAVEKTAKALITKVRSEGFTLLQVLDAMFPTDVPLEQPARRTGWTFFDRVLSKAPTRGPSDARARPSVPPRASLVEQNRNKEVPLHGPERAELNDAVPPERPQTSPRKADELSDIDSSPEHGARTLAFVEQNTESKATLQKLDSLRLFDDASPGSRRTVSQVFKSQSSLDINEIDVSIILWARNLFVKFGTDKTASSHLGPQEVRRLLWRFNLYWSTEDTAKVMCMFLRDHNVKTPSEEMTAQMSFGQFCEFLFEVRHYGLAVRRRYHLPWSRSVSPSERCDLVMRWLYPGLLLLKIAIFLAVKDSYMSCSEPVCP